MPNEPQREGLTRVALIGAGTMAREHARALAAVPGVALAGIHSRSRPRAEALAAEFGVAAVADSVAALWEVTQAALVVVAVSVASMRDVCEQVFEHPWASLLEKPAGHDVLEAEAIAAAAARRSHRAFVALNRRHFSSTRSVLDGLATVDGPRLIQVFDQEDVVAARAGGHPAAVVENWMYANSIHCVDYLRVFGRGDITSVVPTIHWDAGDPRFVAATITFSSGDTGLYSAVWNGPGPWAVTISTQQKRWELRPLEQASYQAHGSRTLERLQAHDWDAQFKPGFRRQAQEAVQAARGEPHGLPSVHDALRTMRLVRDIYA